MKLRLDPLVTNPDHYKWILENDHVRVLEYKDQPGDTSAPHNHPNSVMIAMTSFRRRLQAGDKSRDIEITAGTTNWFPGQQFAGKNIGETPTHVIFVEIKDSPEDPSWMDLGPV